MEKTSHYFVVLFLALSISHAEAGTKLDAVADCSADPGGTMDSQPGLQRCLDTADSETVLYFPAGRYKINSTLTVPKNGMTLYGDAYLSARLTFSGCGDLIKFQRSGKVLYNGGVSKLWLKGDGHCAQTAVHVIDGSWLKIDDVYITDFEDPGGQSIGVKTNGREGFHMRDLRIVANYPVVIDKNPSDLSLAADHFHFENMYTTINHSWQHWHITLLDQATVSNMTIDGQNPMVGGCGILQWLSPTSSNVASFHLKIANARYEQPANGCDRIIDIELSSGASLQNLIIDNVTMTVPKPFAGTGIFLENVLGLSVRDTTYWNASTPQAPANFIDASGIRFLEASNNHLHALGQTIVAKDDFGVLLVAKRGPSGGKHCCYPAGARSEDSVTLGQP
jgi:hypothetical protein